MPYGPAVHGQAKAQPGRRILKSDYGYSTDRANLAHLGNSGLLDAFVALLTAATDYLSPGAIVVITARPAEPL